ncbi:hypothetical protein BASA81_006790 [Batrachochytrium salamandrivorans]|nr:hypothetical protein BASA81_006790 [Batrachochytrium salamandrivorans]
MHQEEPPLGTWIRAAAMPYLVHAAGSCLAIGVVLWLFYYRDGLGSGGWLNWHVLLTVLGFGLVLPEALLVVRFAGFESSLAVRFHLGLQCALVLFAVAGVGAGVWHREDLHLVSFHSWLGVGCCLLLVVQFGLGLGWFVCGKCCCLCRGGSGRRGLASRKQVHRVLGGLVLVCSLLAADSGLQTMPTTVGGGTGEQRVINILGLLFTVTAMAALVALSLPVQERAERTPPSTLDSPLLQ